jgi:uncharacterized membrane protein required for colicin V production
MANKLAVIGSQFAKIATVTIALLGAAYVSWFLYAVYVLHPRNYARNDANYSWLGAMFVVILLILAISTIVLSRYVLGRIARRSDNSNKIHALAVVIMLLSLLPALLSPTAFIFFIFSASLLMLNWIFGRSMAQIPVESQASD